MSLDFDLTGIENYETVCWVETEHGKRMNPLTEGIIFMTMSTGIGEITEKDVVEFWARARVWDTMLGVAPDACVTLDQVRAHIGLKTNVFPRESEAKWSQRIREYALRTLRDYKREAARATAPTA